MVTRSSARDAKILGEHLTAWRKLLGYTSAQVAERAGISRPTLVKLEHGDPTVSVSTLLAVGRALGVAERLVEGIDPYDTELGRASADRVLPERVRR
jgi:transcriptional regulator with XRE-family HTH domain